MDIMEVFRRYPTREKCIEHLERVRWHGEPKCPYCNSTKQTAMSSEHRYHCNNCNTSYSVTVGTIFHNTKMPLQKWFLAVSLVINAKKGIAARQLGRDLHVTKDTAWRILMQIRKAMYEYGELLQGIVEADETYIGGENINRHEDKKTTHGQGRGGGDKQAVVGMIERGGKVKVRAVSDVKQSTIHDIILANIKGGSTLMTDEYGAYKGLADLYDHNVIKHSAFKYAIGDIHTNTIEGFWSLFKRGFVGQYHHLSRRYLQRYLDEFCFRYNNRKNDGIFGLILMNGVCENG
jgi:transposase-like protein